MGKNLVVAVLLLSVIGVGYKVYTAGGFGNGDNSVTSAAGKLVSAVKQRVPVVLYSSDTCRYCVMAKGFLTKKGVDYQVRDVNIGKNAQEMMTRTNGSRSIPQIFINRQHIGGYGELMALEEIGKLDKLLQGMDGAESQ